MREGGREKNLYFVSFEEVSFKYNTIHTCASQNAQLAHFMNGRTCEHMIRTFQHERTFCLILLF